MSNGEIVEKPIQNKDDGSWDSVADVPIKTWADEVEDKKVKRKEALDGYRAASEAFRMDFNERATGPEQFADWIASGEEGITEEEIEFEGKKIKVYHLTGHEFLALVHCIDYRGSKAYEICYPKIYEKSKAIRDDPSNWGIVPPDNNPQNENTGTAKTAKTNSSNNISASLVSNKVPGGHWVEDKRAIYYGFSNLGLRGIITAGSHDMRTQQGWTSRVNNEDFHEVAPSRQTREWTDSGIEKAGSPRAIPTIEEIEKQNRSNEVAIDRYEEDTGRPLTPDFIYCPELITGSVGELTDDQKRHAAYYGIPIVILHRDAYGESQG